MPSDEYTRFLPRTRQARVPEPEETWWAWHRHRIRILRVRRPAARTRVLLVHGAGGHAGALWPVASAVIGDDVELAAVDLPLYGRTNTDDRAGVRYQHWIDLLTDLVADEDDGRPLILLGASIGGMLAYEAASRSEHVHAVAATCLLDPRDRHARARMTRFGSLGRVLGPLAALAVGPLARVMLPIGLVAPLGRMSRDPELSRLCARDPLGGGARVPLGFLASWIGFRHTAPEANRARVALVHPARDDWTPVELSRAMIERAAGGNSVTLLRECGHFPVEEPGLSDLERALASLVDEVAAGAARS